MKQNDVEISPILSRGYVSRSDWMTVLNALGFSGVSISVSGSDSTNPLRPVQMSSFSRLTSTRLAFFA